jgi:hypothetical protein
MVFATALRAYVPGERARKNHATPSGPGHFSFSYRGFSGSFRRIQKIG